MCIVHLASAHEESRKLLRATSSQPLLLSPMSTLNACEGGGVDLSGPHSFSSLSSSPEDQKPKCPWVLEDAYPMDREPFTLCQVLYLSLRETWECESIIPALTL